MQLMPDWFDEWVIDIDEPDELYGSLFKLKENAPSEIQEAFKKFMEEN